MEPFTRLPFVSSSNFQLFNPMHVVNVHSGAENGVMRRHLDATKPRKAEDSSLRTSALLEDIAIWTKLTQQSQSRPICARCIQSSSTYPHPINPPLDTYHMWVYKRKLMSKHHMHDWPRPFQHFSISLLRKKVFMYANFLYNTSSSHRFFSLKNKQSYK